MNIEKKIWSENFQKIVSGKKNTEIRLADFNLKVGDTLTLREYNPKTKKYTGRFIAREVKKLNKVDLLSIYKPKDIKKYGIYLIQLE
ncbi:MAG: DUF3850 domain-containing protein [Nanoarchaeota archaeon]